MVAFERVCNPNEIQFATPVNKITLPLSSTQRHFQKWVGSHIFVHFTYLCLHSFFYYDYDCRTAVSVSWMLSLTVMMMMALMAMMTAVVDDGFDGDGDDAVINSCHR